MPKTSPLRLAALALCGLPALSAAQTAPTYPEGVPVPRQMTAEEAAWLAANPVSRPKGTGTAPVGPVAGPGEYAPCEGIIMTWEGGTALNNIQRQMIRQITTVGAAKAFVVFDNASERDSVMPTFATNSLSVGTDVTRVVPIVAVTDTIWLRDYGPRYVYEGNVRVISDHTYNVLSRTQDNALPPAFGAFRKHKVYTLPLVHGGGNYHLSTAGDGYATQLIANENPSRTQADIINLWRAHWGVQTVITPAFSTAIDATQHIDMWVQIVGDRSVVVSDWPADSGSAQDVICDNRAAAFAAAGYTVARTPARRVGGVHYTYTNMVMCNDLVLLPTYTNATMQQYNAPALAAVQSVVPGKTVVQIPADSLAQLSGVMHCIVMHMPKHLGEFVDGGQAPTALLCGPRAAATFTPGQSVQVSWISDDDDAVTGVDLEFSINGGMTWEPLPGATALTTPNAARTWVVPDVFTANGLLRVTARDADGRLGRSTSPVPFTITGTPCAADLGMTGGVPGPDGILDNNDLVAFVDLFFAGDMAADFGTTGGHPEPDGILDNNDVVAYVDRFFAGC